jgi:hypothetical protein
VQDSQIIDSIGSGSVRHPSTEWEQVMLVDVSHVVEHGMITYKGLPAPLICDFLSREQSRSLYAPGTEFHIGKIEMVANTGTYLDSPFHRYANGKDLAELPLEHLANLEAVAITADLSKSRAIGRATFKDHDLRGKACLLLDVDAVGMVRGKNADQNFLLAQYVNDRPYAASSFMSVAIAQVFGSTLQGRCKDRPELATTAIPLTARIDVLPVRGGERFLRAVFEPLGYEVETIRSPLDE